MFPPDDHKDHSRLQQILPFLTRREKALLGVILVLVLLLGVAVLTPQRVKTVVTRVHVRDHGSFELSVHDLPLQKPWSTWSNPGGAERQYEHQVLSEWPSLRLYLWPGFLSDEECDHLVSVARDRLARSQVVDNSGSGNTVSTHRTSFGMFLNGPEDARDTVVRTVRARIAKYSGFPEQNLEATQILRYAGGQEYKAHFDWFAQDYQSLLQRGGQRISTFLCYLNTPKGGATSFPKLNITSKAVKGTCVQFWDMRSDGTVDQLSLHSADPVEPGSEKWSAPTWIREHEFR
eukprot:TRINITY_DN1551_c0_g1_i1.p1 TRINITY_DN1551_c0_g1~~TRINITY_DN1551_c0_g1_i1.p1  ORF type:complete len:311 (+),score=57.83 TRINITY_DN1551_c0_g1_i1:64-933(+)